MAGFVGGTGAVFSDPAAGTAGLLAGGVPAGGMLAGGMLAGGVLAGGVPALGRPAAAALLLAAALSALAGGAADAGAAAPTAGMASFFGSSLATFAFSGAPVSLASPFSMLFGCGAAGTVCMLAADFVWLDGFSTLVLFDPCEAASMA